MNQKETSSSWANRLVSAIQAQFKKINDPRLFSRDPTISLSDCLMSCFGIFSLKWPSLLYYEVNMKEKNIRQNFLSLFKINTLPSDTYMRERLDQLNISDIAPAYKKIFALLQRSKVLEEYRHLDGYYLISLDGTGYFTSDKVHCKNCCVKEHRNGSTIYYHQMLGAVLVHPDQKAVIPLCPEPIQKEDGATKNDCERNASKRALERIRREHSHLKIMIVEDGLASNGPHIREIESHGMRYILGAKEGDHPFLFEWVEQAEMIEYEYQDKIGTTHRYKFINKVPLNDANFDLKVNFLDYEEMSPKGKRKRFTWVTNVELTKNNVTQIMRGGRARWRIENETFNTLKNQGYQFEHNYGHGKENLSSIMAQLMMLAFLVDQAQLLCCRIYKRAKEQSGTFKNLWVRMRGLLEFTEIENWEGFIMKLARLDSS